MSSDDALPWTTSRCNRLLRPLLSKLAKLRKELERPRSSGGEPRAVSSAFATKGSPVKTTNFTRPAHKPRGFDKVRDPDWRPGAKTGAGKKTYGGRAGRKIANLQRNGSDASNASRPGEIAMTPFLARATVQLHSSPQIQPSPLKKFGKNRGPLLASVEQFTAPRVSADIHKLIHGLSEAYANLLQATTTGDERRWQGTRPLFGACLRKIPAYIELEEHFAQLDKLEEEDTDNREIPNEIYEYLESRFEQRLGQGWRPFRQVVRAHGTTLVCKAITDGILEVPTLGLLVTHCLNVSAWDEAEKLLLAYAPRIEPLPFPRSMKADLFDHQKHPYLAIFKMFVDRTNRHRLIYDLLEHMIAFELLPLEWLATQSMRSTWDRLVRILSENDVRAAENAYRFFETTSLASTGLPDPRLLADEITGAVARRFAPSAREDLRSALNTTFFSLYTVLGSIALVKNNRYNTADEVELNQIPWVLDAINITLSHREDAKDEVKFLDPDKEDAQLYAQRALWTFFTGLFLRLDGRTRNSSNIQIQIPDLIKLVGLTLDIYAFKQINIASILSTLPPLLSSMAQGTGRIWGNDGFDQLQRVVSALTTITGCRLPHQLWTFKRLALETSMEFAHSTGHRDHMAYYRSIENQMRVAGKLVISQSPEKCNSPINDGGFRWEEGIGEWVTCTPFAKQATKRRPRQPMRVLDLLPTPEQSGDEKLKVDCELSEDCIELPTDQDYDEEEEEGNHVLPSSPIRQVLDPARKSIGQCMQTFSPKVVIPGKQKRSMTDDSQNILFFPYLPENDYRDSAPRRSHRSMRELQALSPRCRTLRSRDTDSSGLRKVTRPSYTEPILKSEDEDVDEDVEEGESVSSESEELTNTSSTAAANTCRALRSRSSSTLGKRSRVCSQDGENNDKESDFDELDKTPGRPRRAKRRSCNLKTAKQGEEWWKVRGDVDHESEASEDELSFH